MARICGASRAVSLLSYMLRRTNSYFNAPSKLGGFSLPLDREPIGLDAGWPRAQRLLDCHSSGNPVFFAFPGCFPFYGVCVRPRS